MTNERLSQALEMMEGMSSQARVEACKEDRLLFMAWYFPEYIKYPFADFHFEMFEDFGLLIKGRIRELAWIMFRESAKTSIAKVSLVHTILYGKRKYINVDSFDKGNSESILFDVSSALIDNRRILEDFGQLFSKKRESEEMTLKRVAKFITKNGVMVEAHSTQESVRGRLFRNQRPDFFLIDDFETNKTKDSKAYTEQIKNHIDELATGMDSKAGILYLGNYITEFGVIQSIIDRSKTDRKLKVHMVSVEKNGLPTWPQKYSMTDEEAEKEGKVSLEDKKRQFGSTVYSAEMLNCPIDESTQEFPRRLFKYRKQEELDRLNTRNFLTIDTAISEKAKADYTGFCDNSVDRENFWNLSAWRMKIPPKDLIDTLFTLHEKRHYEKIGIERTIYLQVLKPFLEEEMRKRNKFLPIVDLDHKQQMKEARIRSLQPRYESGSIYHIDGKCGDLEDELLRFPKAKNDDVSDATAYQVQIAQKPEGEWDEEEDLDFETDW